MVKAQLRRLIKLCTDQTLPCCFVTTEVAAFYPDRAALDAAVADLTQMVKDAEPEVEPDPEPTHKPSIQSDSEDEDEDEDEESLFNTLCDWVKKTVGNGDAPEVICYSRPVALSPFRTYYR